MDDGGWMDEWKALDLGADTQAPRQCDFLLLSNAHSPFPACNAQSMSFTTLLPP